MVQGKKIHSKAAFIKMNILHMIETTTLPSHTTNIDHTELYAPAVSESNQVSHQ